MVECQLPKLNTRVRFPSSAPKKAVPSVRMGAARFLFFNPFGTPIRASTYNTVKYQFVRVDYEK